MQILRHLCGQTLERQIGERGTNPPGTYYHLISVGERTISEVRVERCPRCTELLDDSDMVDGAGVPFPVEGLPAWAVERRAVLADLARAGYLFGWENGAWSIRHGERDTEVASAATLEAIIKLARAIVAGADPGGDAPMAA